MYDKLIHIFHVHQPGLILFKLHAGLFSLQILVGNFRSKFPFSQFRYPFLRSVFPNFWSSRFSNWIFLPPGFNQLPDLGKFRL